MSDAPPAEYQPGTGSTDAGLPDTGRTMRMPRRRGAVSGVLLVLFGAWAALAPFVGPYFHFAYTPHARQSWHWTAARGWYEVLPGGLAVVAGVVLLVSTHRVVTVLAGWLAAIAGGWLVVGPTASIVLRLGSIGRPDAATDRRYVAEMLAFFPGAGALIILVAAIAIGRLSARTVGDVRAAAARQEAEQDEYRGYDSEDRAPEQPEPYTGDAHPPYRRYEPDEPTRPVGTVAGAGAGAGLAAAAAGYHGHGGRASYEDADHLEQDDTAERRPQPAADETAELPADRTAELLAAEPAPEPVSEHGNEPEPEPVEHEPLVLEPPAGLAAASAPVPEPPTSEPAHEQAAAEQPAAEQPAAEQAPAQDEGRAPAQVWNPEDQQPTTTGELPRVEDHRPPEQPRRYYRPRSDAQDQAAPPAAEPDAAEPDSAVTAQLPTRSAPEPIRQDEEIGHDLDFDDAPSQGR